MEQRPKKKRIWLWTLLPAALLLGTVLYVLDIPHVSVDRGERHVSVTIGSAPEDEMPIAPQQEAEEIPEASSVQEVLENVAWWFRKTDISSPAWLPTAKSPFALPMEEAFPRSRSAAMQRKTCRC